MHKATANSENCEELRRLECLRNAVDLRSSLEASQRIFCRWKARAVLYNGVHPLLV